MFKQLFTIPIKLSLLIIVFVIFFGALWDSPLKATSPAPEIEWQKTFGGSFRDEVHSFQKTSDGGFILAGMTESKDGDVTGRRGNSDFWIVKIDRQGNLKWQKTLGGVSRDSAHSIDETSDGGFIVSGVTFSEDGDVQGKHGGDDFWIVKLNVLGNLEWQKCLGGSETDISNSIQETSDGGFITTGLSRSRDGDATENHGGFDYWIVKLDRQRNIQWQKSLGGSGNDYANNVLETADGGFIIIGASDSADGDVTDNHGESDAWIVKLNSQGNLEWQKSLGGSLEDSINSIQQTSDGGFIAVGQTKSRDGDVTENHGGDDLWIIKMDSQGNVLWQKTYGGSDYDKADSIQETSDGGFIAAGLTQSRDGDVTKNHGGWDYWILKLDDQGNLEWQKSLGGSLVDLAIRALETDGGGYLVAGTARSKDGDVANGFGGDDIWIVKLYSQEIAQTPQGIMGAK
ncbi:MAG: T9SS C-terminal target domain-containing protein [Deltaproteobacteria bacterium]|nr:T9SS C-terminal target domain-containing protein [Deltaproteobacteria bacterium]